MKTERISYNVNERGRKFRGQDRHFDTIALAKLLNGGDVQERIKHGDMVGYFGHWPRIKFGMNPTEGGIVEGKQVALEPAVRTLSLVAKPDGTIEHEQEFLGTQSGKLAQRLYESKMGGFSSAIDQRRCGDISLPLNFYGFDYVLEPNYTTNRGHEVALDDASHAARLALFDDAGSLLQMFDSVNALYVQCQAAYERQAVVMKELAEENAELLSMLVNAGGKKPERVLDSIAPQNIYLGEAGRLAGAERFLDAPLTTMQVSKADEKKTKADGVISRLFGFR